MNGWRTARLASLCALFTDGDWIESKDQSLSGIRLVQTGNVGDGSFKDRVEKARYISDATFERLRCTELQEGDCLISRLPDPVGRACLLPALTERAITAVDCTIARFDGQKIEPEFFNYYAQSRTYFDAIHRATSGATRLRISRKNLGYLEIPLPPLEEQRRIVAVLDEAFAAIATATANAEKNLANAREFARVTLLTKTQSLSEERRPLEEICIVDWGNTNLTKSAYVDDGVALAVSATGCDGRIGHAEHQPGVPVLSAIGARCGRMFFPNEPFTAIKNTITLTPRPSQADGKFLYYLLESIDLPQRGSAQPFIAKGDINRFEVPVPTLEDQKMLAQQMDEVFEQCAGLERLGTAKRTLLDKLKQSLVHSAFAGELTKRELVAA